MRVAMRNGAASERRIGRGLLGAALAVGLLATSGSAAPRPSGRALEPDAVASLRRAVVDLSRTWGARYPRGAQFLARLEHLEKASAAADSSPGPSPSERLATLRREALLGQPAVTRAPILFVVRRQYRPDHHNTATMFQTGEINTGSFQGGGALKVVDPARGGETRTLVELEHGVVRDPDVSFDGTRIIVSLRRDRDDDYHLWVVPADGSPSRQLTRGRGVSDIDPIWLPDGTIAFTSTREPKYCMCNRHIMGNLFRMNADGSNIHQIGHSTLHEGHSSLLEDGRLVYDRWEYVDRNFGDAQGLWTCYPDGTRHQIFWGNSTPSPGAVLDARALPGGRCIATFSSCHDRPWGALAIIDPALGLDGKRPVIMTWPPGARDLVMKGNYDRFKSVRPRYEDPWPLDAPEAGVEAGRWFLCSREIEKERMGIFLVDIFGNEALIHDEAPGCYDPMPLAPRRAPPALADHTDLSRSEGAVYIQDVYRGQGVEGVERGTVRYVRVVESPEKRFWTHPAWNGSGTQAPAMAWNDFNNKRILGTVEVEADGSAYFSLPADRFVFFQLLDADGMMVQTMRSGTLVRPGETSGCVGCHDDRLTAAPNGARRAWAHGPRRLRPWHGPERLFSYTAEVQPVFDRYCVSCHDFGKPAGEKLLLSGDRTLAFNVSYMELRRRNLVSVIGAGPARVLPPGSWGSRRSRLVEVIRKGHEDVELDPESLDRIVTWIDINAPYYPSYASTYRNNQYGRSPLNPQQVARLGTLAGVDLARQSPEPRVSFTRPRLSPILRRLDPASPEHAEALAIIEAGKKTLAERPREDMPGCRLTGIEREREEKYERLAREEAAVRRAIAAGERRLAP